MCWDDYSKVNNRLKYNILSAIRDDCDEKAIVEVDHYDGTITFKTTNTVGGMRLDIVALFDDFDFREQGTIEGNTLNI